MVSLALIHFIAIFPADSAIQLLNYRKFSINPPPLPSNVFEINKTPGGGGGGNRGFTVLGSELNSQLKI